MPFSPKELKMMANAARAGAMRAIRAARSGHVGIALGAADIMTAVYANHLRFDPRYPDWPGRDRFVLSAGHGSALLYSVLGLAGYDIPDLSGFRKMGSPLAGHPEYGALPGVECSTGPLGQGLANAVGMALAEKIRSARAARKNEARIYCLCGDGDLMEGVAQETVALAGIYKLNNLILLWDDNGISIDGAALTDSDVPGRMSAAGWKVLKIDGRSPAAINNALSAARKYRRAPVFVQCRTEIGCGSSVAGTNAAHGMALGDAELAELEEKFNNPAGAALWKRLSESSRATEPESRARPSSFVAAGACRKLQFSRSDMSTRAASFAVLEQLARMHPELIGGSADLAESTQTKTAAHRGIAPGDFSGNFIDYGVREHAMAAVMNGLCLGGLRPYGGTFLAFSDYMRPAMRLSAIMGLPVIYVFSHDSIAVGEDGPTHQPIEQLAGLRLIPNMAVFRPADMMEVAACWEAALARTDGPSCIILSRQKLPALSGTSAAGVRRGGYLLESAEKNAGKADVGITILATGGEVSLALDVQKILTARGAAARVASIPCVEIFRAQPAEYKNKILNGTVIACEAGATYGWYEFADATIGIDAFGASGNGADVYRHFGFDAARIADEILKKIK
jgi:transketolase